MRALLGPNLWADFPVVEIWLDLSAPPLNDWLPAAARLRAGLTALLPGLALPRRPPADQGHPQYRQRHERWLVQVFLETVRGLFEQIGERPGFTAERGTSEPGVYLLAIERVGDACAETCSESCAETALDIIHDLLAGTDCMIDVRLDRLRVLARDAAPSPTGVALATAARARGIPTRRLPGNLLQLGHGARQRRLLCNPATTNGGTVDRDLLSALMASAGLCCTEGPASGAHHRVLVAGRRVLAILSWQPGPGGNGSGPKVADVSALVHGDVRARALDAVRALGLETAEVCLVTADITQPLVSQGGLISEVLADPPLDLYLEAVRSPPIAEAFLATLFPAGENGRIPIVAISGTNGKTTVTRLVAHGLSVSGRFVGMTCTDGIYLADRRIDTDDCSGPRSARRVLLNPQVEAAVLETARGGILREGLGFDACDVAVVTNLGEGDHLGLGWIDTLEALAEVKQTVVRAVAPGGIAVLNAADPLVARMASHCQGRVLFFARDGHDPLVQWHRREGGRAAFVRGHELILAEGRVEWPLLSLRQIPLTGGGRIGFQVENCLAGAAALWGLGLAPETIGAALETFGADLDKSPGRFNVLSIHGATVVFDYGHNPSALLAMIEALKHFPHRRRIAVYSAAGDRRDCDLIRQGEILGGAFDRVILYEDHYTRGRRPGEIMALFAQGLASGDRVKEIDTIHGWRHAVEETLWLAQPGDLILVQADAVDETVEYVQARLSDDQAWQESPLSVMVMPVAAPLDRGAAQAQT